MVDEALLLEKLKTIEDKVDGLQDTEQLTELDIINLKNEIEKIKIGTTTYVPDDIEENVRRLEKLAESADVFEQWKKTISEIDVLRKNIEKASSVGVASEIPSDYGEKIEELKRMVSDAKSGTDPELIKRIEDLETRVRSIKPVRIPEGAQDYKEPIESLKKQIESLSNDIIFFKKSGGGQKPLPPILGEFEKIKSSLSSLEGEMRKIKTGAQEAKSSDDIRMKVAALFSRMEGIENRLGEKGSISHINKKIEIIEERLGELSKGYNTTGLRELEKEVDSLFSKIDINDSKINTVFADMNKKLSLINSKMKSPPTKKMVPDTSTLELKKSLKDLQNRLTKIESAPKKGTSDDVSSLKNEMISLKKGLEQTITKQEFLEFEQNLVPPKIPDAKDVEDAMKRGIALEKEIEKINKKSVQIEQFLRRKDDIDKIREDVKKLVKENEELKKIIPSVRNSLPGPPTGVPAKLLQTGMSKYSEDLDYLRKNLLKNEAELSRNMSDIRNRLVENEKRIDNVMNELAKTLKNFHEGPLPPGTLSDDNSGRIMKEISNIKKDVDSRITENAVKDFENEVYRELETMNKTIRDSVKNNTEYAKRVNIELSAIEEKMKNIERGHETIKGIDPGSLIREIEMLKGKQKWIEENIEHFDLEPLHEKIADFERRLNMLKINSPLIIE
ncbi:MAG: hypothetical protein JW716_05765 [Candidatus Aenigmarchaeota archaeon]|nr:hypothetical protein [Candidatus Aenigmarchaeota archaeon]